MAELLTCLSQQVSSSMHQCICQIKLQEFYYRRLSRSLNEWCCRTQTDDRMIGVKYNLIIKGCEIVRNLY